MTEPTEEQRRAAEVFCVGNLMGYVMQVARLLAEREAKLREEYQAPTQDVVIDMLRARVAELEAVVAVKDEERTMQVSMIQSLRNAREAQHLADIKAAKDALERARASVEGWAIRSNDDTDSMHNEDQEALDEIDEVLARLAHYDDAKADAPAEDMQAWANGSCPEPGCSLANPHEQGVACVKPTAEGGEG